MIEGMTSRSFADRATLTMAVSLYCGPLVLLHWGSIVEAVSREGASGWAQAFGSVAAILGSYFLLRIQLQKADTSERERRRRDASDRHGALVAIMLDAWWGVDAATQWAVVPSEAASRRLDHNPAAELTWATRELDRVDPSSLPGVHITESFLWYRRRVHSLLPMVDEYDRAVAKGENITEHLQRLSKMRELCREDHSRVLDVVHHVTDIVQPEEVWKQAVDRQERREHRLRREQSATTASQGS